MQETETKKIKAALVQTFDYCISKVRLGDLRASTKLPSLTNEILQSKLITIEANLHTVLFQY